MTNSTDRTYFEPPMAGDEIDTLLGSLERQRATFEWKCEGVDAPGLQATVGISTVTLGGLLKHLAAVEATHFRWKFLGTDPGPPWNSVDWDADPDWEWHTATDHTPEELTAMWREAVAGSRAVVADALAEAGLDQLSRREYPDGRAPSLRRLIVDLIEEYGRHVGHADLIREAVDGRVGEDPAGRPVEYSRGAPNSE